ncbi:MAG: ATP-binding cassette domain-containing protein, partial [Rhodococcus sp.]|nr:ATP-binding cassette domain-containing protein [Rhodococcus sp. (in: high G+C Gram-positive bacteria)]
FAFALAGAVGSLAGVTSTPLVFVTYQSGLLLTVYGFIAAAFGGMRSIPGAVAGGLLVGVLESLMAYYGDSALKTPMAFGLLVVILVYRAAREQSGVGWLPSLRSNRAGGALTALPRATPLSRRQQLATSRARIIAVTGVLVLAFLGPLVFTPYWVSLWCFIGVFVIVGIGLDLLLGYTGQLSLGQTTFMGVSAYAVALAIRWWDVPAWLAAAFAIAFTSALAACLGGIVLRLRGYYFTFATLAIAIAAEAMANGMPGQLGGPSGIRVRATLSIAGFELDSPGRLFTATWLVVALTLIVALRLTNSRFGQAMKVVGTDEDLAAAAAVTPFAVKLRVFVLSAAMASVGGVLYAHILMFVSPHSLGLVGGFDAIVGLLLGGFGTVWGALVGIPIIRLLPELISRLDTYEEFVQGLLVVGLVIALPDGVVGAGQRAARRLAALRTGRGSTEQAGISPVFSSNESDSDQLVVPAAALTATGVTKRFGGLLALEDVGLAVAPGAIVGLIGPNGAGKSTCLGVLAGAIRPDDGRISLAGVDVTSTPADARARAGVVRTFQLPHTPPGMTALEVAMLGASRRGRSGPIRAVVGSSAHERAGIKAAAMDALELVGIADRQGHQAAALSTGEQKMLELARALAAAPSVLLADEPAGGLFDDEIERLATVLVRVAAGGVAIVLVEHHMDLVMGVCDEIVVLNEGRVIAVGGPAEVRSNKEVLDAYLGA